MLIKDNQRYQMGMVIVMSDLAILAASVKTTLLEVAKQAQALGVGLQNAAPGERSNAPNNSVQYLMATSENLTKLAELCDKLTLNTKSGPEYNSQP